MQKRELEYRVVIVAVYGMAEEVATSMSAKAICQTYPDAYVQAYANSPLFQMFDDGSYALFSIRHVSGEESGRGEFIAIYARERA